MDNNVVSGILNMGIQMYDLFIIVLMKWPQVTKPRLSWTINCIKESQTQKKTFNKFDRAKVLLINIPIVNYDT